MDRGGPYTSLALLGFMYGMRIGVSNGIPSSHEPRAYIAIPIVQEGMSTGVATTLAEGSGSTLSGVCARTVLTIALIPS